MSTADFDDDLIEAVAFTSANSRAYLSAVFAAHREGRVVALMPSASQAGPARRNIPGVRFVDRVSFAPDHGWFDEAQSPIFSDDPAQIVFFFWNHRAGKSDIAAPSRFGRCGQPTE